MIPQVFNQNAPHDAIYVGRGTLFGNPFVIGKNGTREQVIELYRGWLETHPSIVNAARQQLRGKNLRCYCKPLACHADVLLEIANS